MIDTTRLTTALAGRYSIERELGAGGMAIVYLAQDVKHRRKVALKVLRAELAATMGAERFGREIEVAAQLQHPHILPLLDSGEAAGFYYYVMPYIEGESLRDRLAHHGELPVHDAVKVLIEVVDALTYAHAHGVVHRDIKPDNIMLSGRHALVTDFGVAKAVSEATGAHTLTSVGVALGTPAYMAPEQAAADPHLDHRVDLYAVGVLGYELLTGRTPFSGLSPQETLAAHVTQAPEPVDKHRPGLSPTLSGVLMKCLAKRPADRWQTADELLAQLEPLATPSGGMTPTASQPAVMPRRMPRWIPWGAGGALLAVALGVAFLQLERPGPLVSIGKRVAVASGPDFEFWPSLSPDGKLVAFSRTRGGNLEEVVQQVDGGTPVVLTDHLPGANGYGALSPDGQRVLFFSRAGLHVMPSLGGPARLVVQATSGGRLGLALWGCWSPDGKRIAYSRGDTLFTQATEGSDLHPITSGRFIHSPSWSPDGQWIAYVEGNSLFHYTGNLAPSSIMVVPAGGGRAVSVAAGGSLNTSPVWVPGRRALLFVSDREGGRDIYELYLTGTGAAIGVPRRITTGLNPDRLSISADGRRISWSEYTESSNIWSLALPSRDSAAFTLARPVTSGTQQIETVAISSDGAWLYYDSNRSGHSNIWRQPLSGGAPEQLTTDSFADFDPQVSPDGREIAFHSLRTGNRDVFVMGVGGGGEVQVTTSPQEDYNPSWGADGQSLVWDEQLNHDSALWTARRGRDGAWERPRLLALSPGGGGLPRVSPDGRWVAFNSPAGLKFLEVATGTVRAASSVSGWLAWSDDSHTVYFATAQDSTGHFTIKSLPVNGGPPRTVVYGNDPRSQSYRYGLAVHGGRLYFPLIESKGDVWVADLQIE